MSIAKKFSASLVFAVCLLFVLLCGYASADETDSGAELEEAPVYVDGLLSCRGYRIGDDTYVSFEAACAVLGYDAVFDYDKEIDKLTVEVAGIEITVGCADEYMCANGRYIYLPDGYREVKGSFVVPTEALAKIFTLTYQWDEKLGAINFITADEQILTSGDEYYNEDDIYWMSRIITWESGNQPIAGQIAVGNVILNRVGDSRFGQTVKDVIFQPGQFSVVTSGAINGQPYAISEICAKLVYEGYNTVGNALFFQTGRYWGSSMIKTTWVAKIGDHNFFM